MHTLHEAKLDLRSVDGNILAPKMLSARNPRCRSSSCSDCSTNRVFPNSRWPPWATASCLQELDAWKATKHQAVQPVHKPSHENHQPANQPCWNFAVGCSRTMGIAPWCPRCRRAASCSAGSSALPRCRAAPLPLGALTPGTASQRRNELMGKWCLNDDA